MYSIYNKISISISYNIIKRVNIETYEIEISTRNIPKLSKTKQNENKLIITGILRKKREAIAR